jgi:hypothetical protein
VDLPRLLRAPAWDHSDVCDAVARSPAEGITQQALEILRSSRDYETVRRAAAILCVRAVESTEFGTWLRRAMESEDPELRRSAAVVAFLAAFQQRPPAALGSRDEEVGSAVAALGYALGVADRTAIRVAVERHRPGALLMSRHLLQSARGTRVSVLGVISPDDAPAVAAKAAELLLLAEGEPFLQAAAGLASLASRATQHRPAVLARLRELSARGSRWGVWSPILLLAALHEPLEPVNPLILDGLSSALPAERRLSALAIAVLRRRAVVAAHAQVRRARTILRSDPTPPGEDASLALLARLARSWLGT